MAKPRVFISSTFYDLRQIREELDRFVVSMGYEPVRHEVGGIPYSKDKPLEESAYAEVERCDILVTVVGGRFGTESGDGSGASITQREIKRALEKNIQVFIFVESAVLAELRTWRLNQNIEGIKYASAENVKIFEFLEELYKLKTNNAIQGFQTGKQIVDFLRDQWAGLFQQFLANQKRVEESRVLDEMRTIAGTLQQVVDFFSKQKSGAEGEAVKSILQANHPAFRRFASLTNTRYRVFFTSEAELNDWLTSRQWTPVPVEEYDEGSFLEWTHKGGGAKAKTLLKVVNEIFDDGGALIPITEGQWSDSWVVTRELTEQRDAPDDDIPF